MPRSDCCGATATPSSLPGLPQEDALALIEHEVGRGLPTRSANRRGRSAWRVNGNPLSLLQIIAAGVEAGLTLVQTAAAHLAAMAGSLEAPAGDATAVATAALAGRQPCP